jgi:hypothetical protein
VRYSTIDNWAKYFEKTEGVRICKTTIREKLKKAEIIGITARNKVRIMLKNAFFSETDVRSACKELLQHHPQADEEGLFVKDGEKYGTISAWSEMLEISADVGRFRIKTHKPQSIKGKDKGGRLFNFYSESVIRALLFDLLESYPQANEEGFFIKDGEKYGTVVAWSKVLGVSKTAMTSRIVTHGHKSIKGKDIGGNVRNFFSKPAIREICADLIQDIPHADENGFCEKGSEKYGTIAAWSRVLKISEYSISARFNPHSPIGIKGKDKSGHVCDFFSEIVMCQICADLLQDIPQADETGFFEKDGEKYGTIGSWSKVLGISCPSITSRLKPYNLQSVKGKNSMGRVCDFYPKSSICTLCADLLAKRNPSTSLGTGKLNPKAA